MQDKYAMSQEENIFCAKRILVDSVYQQANLEGIGVTFADTQDILNDVNVNYLTPTEISKVCCLRDGWKYLLEHLSAPEDFVCMQEIHEIVARFDVDYRYLGKFRTEDVLISGTQWRPSLPNPDRMWEEMQKILSISGETDRAVTLGLWIMRTQPFKDGNKRIGSFLINKILNLGEPVKPESRLAVMLLINHGGYKKLFTETFPEVKVAYFVYVRVFI